MIETDKVCDSKRIKYDWIEKTGSSVSWSVTWRASDFWGLCGCQTRMGVDAWCVGFQAEEGKVNASEDTGLLG